MLIERHQATDRCMFCAEEIEDLAYGFVRHTQESRDCRRLWRQWREFMDEDFGGA